MDVIAIPPAETAAELCCAALKPTVVVGGVSRPVDKAPRGRIIELVDELPAAVGPFGPIEAEFTPKTEMLVAAAGVLPII